MPKCARLLPGGHVKAPKRAQSTEKLLRGHGNTPKCTRLLPSGHAEAPNRARNDGRAVDKHRTNAGRAPEVHLETVGILLSFGEHGIYHFLIQFKQPLQLFGRRIVPKSQLACNLYFLFLTQQLGFCRSIQLLAQ